MSYELQKATPMEKAQIELSLLELRHIKGVTMAGIDKWCLYYPVCNSINVGLIPTVPTSVQPEIDRTMSTSSSSTSLDRLIAAADELLQEDDSLAMV